MRLAPHKVADATMREEFEDGDDDVEDDKDEKDAGTVVHSRAEKDKSVSDVMQCELLLLLQLLLLLLSCVSIT